MHKTILSSGGIIVNFGQMHPVQVKELKPLNPLLLGYIETYKWISAEEPLTVRTIPNGRLDAWITLTGRFWWQHDATDEFQALPDSGFFPLTRLGNRAKTEKKFSCISIKIFPHALTLPVMADQQLNQPLSFPEIFDSEACSTLAHHLHSTSDPLEHRKYLDQFFAQELFRKGTPDQWMRDVINALEKGAAAQMTMMEIADQNHVTIKTLERRFKRVFGISPKLFADLIRLQETAKNIRHDKHDSLSHGDLAEALGFGYYDQSHFVKACKKITGLTPKQLFTKLPGQVTDFLIE